MCGLAGRFHPEHLAEAPGWAARAGELLRHRGPDGAGAYRDENCELVHRRLALLDLSPTGHQPMANEDGTVWIAFNGEIYNHAELRETLLARGHRFRGTSDTEVLVHLFEEHGRDMVHRLRGIFAFAIYDRRRQCLLLARDRFGVKPLFVARVGEDWVFASEIKAIAAAPGFVPVLDRQACYDFLGLSYVPEPATGFANVRALPPATTVLVTPGGHVQARYHAVRADVEERDFERTVDSLGEKLEHAVRLQSVADVPVAALLSGGIDSSLVVAARRRATGGPTSTFNVRFPDPLHDETAVARAVATQWGTQHHTIEAGAHGMRADTLIGLLRHFDQPFADTSLIPMYWVSAAVRERGIICALSGDGGDEAFGGYARFWRANRLVRLMHLPPALRHVAALAGRTLSGVTRDWGRQLAKAVDLADGAISDSAILLGGLASYLTEAQKAELVLSPARETLLPGCRHFDGYEPRGAANLEELSRRMTETLFAVSLPSDMLRKVDMMSMRASIEVRVPLLDEELVDLGLTLPHRMKTDGRHGKLALRALARRWLTREVAAHPKHGFSIPLDVMAPPDLHEAVHDVLLGRDARTAAFVDKGLVARWVKVFRRSTGGGSGGAISRAGLYQRVMMLLSLELWLRDYGLSW